MILISISGYSSKHIDQAMTEQLAIALLKAKRKSPKSFDILIDNALEPLVEGVAMINLKLCKEMVKSPRRKVKVNKDPGH